jgi:hypothetical protein
MNHCGKLNLDGNEQYGLLGYTAVWVRETYCLELQGQKVSWPKKPAKSGDKLLSCLRQT